LIFFHGYALSTVMIGAEPTPLFAYFIGLLFSEGFLLSIGMICFRGLTEGKNLFAGVLLGAGLALTYEVILA